MTTPSTSDAWVGCPRPNPASRLRLFCFPYAGGGASIYSAWWRELPAHTELCAIKLPGREARLSEPPFERLTPLVQALATALDGWLAKPFAFYGHSLGALVSFELARELRRRGAPLPRHLFVSGRRAPHQPISAPLHGLPDDAFLAWLRRMGGTPEEVLREPDLLALFLPVLRADVAVNEAEPFVPGPPLDCPISAFGGDDDERASPADIEAWRELTRGPFRAEVFPGGHFFLRTARAPLLRSISAVLDDVARDLPA
ncbi:thioesterase II family protein [Sorangium cellulosum]|uniref:Gramicidin dehydrogenase n=1 Tax=Sorangium cellulosum TaxID=56 RepID=A0A150QNQ8_SORCE|nr:thioesterase domain-containing protein [Sorangium cellulosum]KYF69472.1 gramicidin dehydrogenase [Sorangium cellulosum]